MSKSDGIIVQVDVIQELRALAERGADVPELVDVLLKRLELQPEKAVFRAFLYFRTAFGLTLPEVLPLREWLGCKDRSEIDSILTPAMQRTKSRWQSREVMQA
jgi:hypothetical protein